MPTQAGHSPEADYSQPVMKYIVAIAIALALAGCSAESGSTSSQSPTPSVSFSTTPNILGPDLLIYLTELGKIGTLENQLVGLFDAVSGSNFQNDDILARQLEQIIPKSQEFLSKLEGIVGTQTEISTFHNKYVDIWQRQVEAFGNLKTAIDTKDQVLYEAALAAIADARKGIEPLQQELKAMSEYAGVELQF